MRKIFLNAMHKLWPENSLPLPRNCKKKKRFHSVMALITVFTQYRNPSKFKKISTF